MDGAYEPAILAFHAAHLVKSFHTNALLRVSDIKLQHARNGLILGSMTEMLY
jgi:hypothetical protein